MHWQIPWDDSDDSHIRSYRDLACFRPEIWGIVLEALDCVTEERTQAIKPQDGCSNQSLDYLCLVITIGFHY